MENTLHGDQWPRPPKVNHAQPSTDEGKTAREGMPLTRIQRTHSQMSGIDLDSILSHQTATSEQGEAQEQSRIPPTFQTSRYSGDGFDFRRPATPSRVPSGTSNPHNVPEYMEPPEIVDLTNAEDVEMPPSPRSLFGLASRGPRFARDIIDLSGEMPNARPSSSDEEALLDALEVQFVSERPLPPPANSRGIEIPLNNVFDLTEDDVFLDSEDDDVQFIMEMQRPSPTPRTLPLLHPTRDGLPQQNTTLLRTASSMANSLRQLAGYRTDHLNHSSSRSSNGPPPLSNPPSLGPLSSLPRGFASATGRAVAINMGINAFISPELDFGSVGFDMGLDEPSHDNAAVRRIPPPPSPPPGFTRTPKPDEVYICPNCDRELCTGDTDIQKQIWIIRACGHVSNSAADAHSRAVLD